MDKTKYSIAIKNGEIDKNSLKQFRKTEIVKGLRKNGIRSADDENAIFRESIVSIINCLIESKIITDDQASIIFKKFIDQTKIVNDVKESLDENFN